jgi:MFS family permease
MPTLASVKGPPTALLGMLTIAAYGSWYYGFGVLLPDLQADLGSSENLLAAGFGAAHLSTGLLGVLTGRELDRRGSRNVFLVGIGGAGFLAASSFARDPLLFAVVFGLGGGLIGSAGFYPVTQTVAARWAPGAEVRAIARLTIWGAFASPVFIPATELARRTWGWRTTIRIDALLVAVAFLAAAALSGRYRSAAAERPSPKARTALRLAVADPTTRRLATAAVATAGSVSILLLYQVPIMIAAGLGAGTASAMAATRGVAQLLGRLPLVPLVDRFGAFSALRAARITVAVACVLLAVGGGLPVVAVAAVMAGAAIGALSPLDGIAARATLPPDDLGALLGTLALCTGVAAAVLPVVAATVVDLTGDRRAAALLAAVLAVVAAASLHGTRREAARTG